MACLLQGIGNAFQAEHAIAIQGHGTPAQVADGVNVGIAGAGVLIHHDAVLAAQVGGARQLIPWHGANADYGNLAG
ncbi:hypothetical protein D3C76_1486580 [compost metagenome]